MGLAPYGKPVYKERILRDLIHLDEAGAVTLNQKYFNFIGELTMTNAAFDDLFGGPPRKPESQITQREMDIAASIQAVTEEAVVAVAQHAREKTGMRHLVMAGGVALNVAACGLLARKGIFDKIWIQPASGDAGGPWGLRSGTGTWCRTSPVAQTRMTVCAGLSLGLRLRRKIMKMMKYCSGLVQYGKVWTMRPWPRVLRSC